MATAIEYGLIAAGIGIAVIAAVYGVGMTSRWDDDSDKKKAAAACAAPHTGDTVLIKNWIGNNVEYECPYWPSISYPTLVRRW
jgi:Flp pilus assembly pilin Flp